MASWFWNNVGSPISNFWDSVTGNDAVKKGNEINEKVATESNALQKEAYEYQKWYDMHKYQLDAQGLQSAGLSKTLSAGATSGTQVGTPNLDQVNIQQTNAPLGFISDGLDTAISLMRMDKEFQMQDQAIIGAKMRNAFEGARVKYYNSLAESENKSAQLKNAQLQAQTRTLNNKVSNRLWNAVDSITGGDIVKTAKETPQKVVNHVRETKQKSMDLIEKRGFVGTMKAGWNWFKHKFD